MRKTDEPQQIYWLVRALQKVEGLNDEAISLIRQKYDRLRGAVIITFDHFFVQKLLEDVLVQRVSGLVVDANLFDKISIELPNIPETLLEVQTHLDKIQKDIDLATDCASIPWLHKLYNNTIETMCDGLEKRLICFVEEMNFKIPMLGPLIRAYKEASERSIAEVRSRPRKY